MYRKSFVFIILVAVSLLISSATMAQETTTPDQGAASPRSDSPTPDAAVLGIEANLGTVFSYQGRIKKDGNLVNGTCNMAFSLWDTATAGTQQGATQSISNIIVSEGLFTVQLNDSGQFGPNAFNGQKRYLGISIQCPSSAPPTTLTPRQELTVAPYATHAQHASALYALDGRPQVDGALEINGVDFVLRGRGGGAGNNGGRARALVDGGSADGLIVNYADDFGKVVINGNVGIGTTTPQARLDVDGDLTVRGADFVLRGRGGGVGNNGGKARALVDGGSDGLIVNFAGDFGKVAINGPVGIGNTNPGRTLEVGNVDVASDGVIRFSHRDGPYYRSWDVGTGDPGAFGENDNFGIRDVMNNSTVLVIAHYGSVGIGTNSPSPQAKLDVAGWTRTDVLQIDAGADLAEPFAITGEPEPGLVVAIDPDHIGQLRIADKPYDRTVAGVISGAGGLRPGLTMQQPEIVQGKAHPVALTGRVYVWADASFGAIQPGDLLTTSATPGHAMKVSDHEQAQGAVLGKAMSRLEGGKGLVLVLVSLQ